MGDERVTRGRGLLERVLARRRAKIADGLIPSGHRRGCILDLGCGSYPLFLLQTSFAFKIGLDLTVTGSFGSFSDSQPITFVRHDFDSAAGLPIRSNACSVVTMLAVMEHIEPVRVTPLLLEIRRVLQPAGILIITTPVAWTDLVLRAMARIRLVSPVEIEDHKAAYDRVQLTNVLRGVFPEQEVKIGLFEWGMNMWAVASKPDRSKSIAS